MSGTNERKRCYYEIMGVLENCDAKALKKAYRRLCMELHPDRNRDNKEVAQEMYAAMQNAYEILSDPHERAWYDQHKEEILNPNANHEASSLNLNKYFTSACYKGFEDDEEGFFGVYNFVFNTINREEGSDLPAFGRAGSNLSNVKTFYTRWGQFSSSQTFSWVDVWDTRDGNNRYERRWIEKENNKARKEERKKFNQLVRELILFVQRRDPRWHDLVAAEEERRQTDEMQREIRMQQQAEERLIEQALEQKKWEEQQARIETERERQGISNGMDEYLTKAEELFNPTEKRNKKNKKGKKNGGNKSFNCLVCNVRFTDEVHYEAHMQSGQHLRMVEQRTQKKNKKARKAKKRSAEEEPRRTKTEKNVKLDALGNPMIDSDDEEQQQQRRNEKRQKRKEKRKAKKAAGAGSFACNVCGEVFTTRNALFEHVRELGHALHVEEGGKKKKKKRRR
ncbi:hypothetical protein PCE1_000494 [Barthelona sp. PCE]